MEIRINWSDLTKEAQSRIIEEVIPQLTFSVSNSRIVPSSESLAEASRRSEAQEILARKAFKPTVATTETVAEVKDAEPGIWRNSHPGPTVRLKSAIKAYIAENALEFGGTMTGSEIRRQTKISSDTYCKFRNEVKEELGA